MEKPTVVFKCRSYLLPREFWGALLEIRSYLLLDAEFTSRVFNPLNPNRSSTLRTAFDLMDSMIDVATLTEATE